MASDSRPRRRWLAAGGVLCAIVGAGAGRAAVLTDSGSSTASEDPATAEETATVRRGDLEETTTTSGSLEYADVRQLTSGLSGVLTWLPQVGQVRTPERPDVS